MTSSLTSSSDVEETLDGDGRSTSTSKVKGGVKVNVAVNVKVRIKVNVKVKVESGRHGALPRETW